MTAGTSYFTSTAMPPSAGECRLVRGFSVGSDARQPDLRGNCGVRPRRHRHAPRDARRGPSSWPPAARAAGGAELAGLRALDRYLNRSALQGHLDLLASLV